MTPPGRILEWLVGESPVAEGETLRIRPILESPWLGSAAISLMIVALAAALFLWIDLIGSRRLPPKKRLVALALRVSSLILLALCVLRLSLTVERVGLPGLAVVVDTSASMSREDVRSATTDGRLSRLKAVQDWADGERSGPLERLSRAYRVHLFQAANDAQEIPSGVELRNLQADGPETRLATALRTVLGNLRGAPPAAVIVFSDGASTAGAGEMASAAAGDAQTAAVPIWTVGLGSTSAAADREVVDALADDVALSGETVTFDVRLRTTESGSPSGEVRLKNGAGEIVDRATWPEPQKGDASLKLHDRPTRDGKQVYSIEAEPLSDEIDLSNNTRTASVMVRAAKLKVLYLERLPRWEFRHLKAALERDRSVELRIVLLDADVDYVREDRTALPVAPQNASDLAGYDAFIIGDVPRESLADEFLDLVRESVRQGAGLIMLAGPRFNPDSYRGTVLEGLLPISLLSEPTGNDKQDADPVLSLAGREHPLLQLGWESAAELPRLNFWAMVGSPKPAATALATVGGDSQAVLATQRFGSGQVLWVGTDELWKWRRLREDQLYGRFWSQAVRWVSRARLAGGQLAARLRTDRRVYLPGETVRISLAPPPDRELPKTEEASALSIEQADGARETIALSPSADGELKGMTRAVRPGTVRLVWTGSPSGSAVEWDYEVRRAGAESAGAPLDRDDLVKAAEETHGRYLDWSEVNSLLSQLPEGRRVVSSQATVLPIWNRWGTALLFCALVGAEWFVRRRNQLV